MSNYREDDHPRVPAGQGDKSGQWVKAEEAARSAAGISDLSVWKEKVHEYKISGQLPRQKAGEILDLLTRLENNEVPDRIVVSDGILSYTFDNGTFTIKQLVINPERLFEISGKSSGIGTQLFSLAIEKARSLGASNLALVSQNYDSDRFYSKMGMTKVGETIRGMNKYILRIVK